MNRSAVATGVMVVMILSAVVLTSLSGKRRLFPQPMKPMGTVNGWREVASVGPRVGPADAPVTVVVFSDYQCSFCSALHDKLAVLRESHPHNIAVVWRHLPLPGHQTAFPAAKAVICSADQGHFEAMHALAFGWAQQPDSSSWTALAWTAGVDDTLKFAACMRSSRSDSIIDRDMMLASQLDILGTPTFLVNSRMYGGLPKEVEPLFRRAMNENEHR